MSHSLIGAALAFLGGAVIALLNAWLTGLVLRKKPSVFSSFFAVRQILNIAYLALVYYLSRFLPWGLAPLLLGAAIGLTVPSFFFTARLTKHNDELHKKNSSPKGDDDV